MKAPATLSDVGDIEAEKVVLSTCLVDETTETVDYLVSVGLLPEHFLGDLHARIWAAILDLHAAGEPTDGASVWHRIKKADRGDAGKIGDLFENPYRKATINQALSTYYRSIKAHWIARKLYSACTEVQVRLADGDIRPAVVIDAANYLTAETQKVLGEVDPPRTMRMALEAAMDEVANRAAGKGGVCYRSGIPALDTIVGGAERGEVTIIGARPSVGKSVLAMQWTLDAVLKQGARAVFCSTENKETKLVFRMQSYLAEVYPGQCSGAMPASDEEWGRIYDACDQLDGAKLDPWDAKGVHVAQIAARCRARARQWGGVDLLVVDFLQRCKAKAASRELEIAAISSGLADLAKELNIAVIIASQLNRGVEGRGDKARPKLSDLRESGTLEQDAFRVVLISRLEKDGVKSPDAQLIVAKNKDAECGVVEAVFEPKGMRFRARSDY